MVTTGSETAVTQTPPPPRPPATDGSSKTTTFNFARSASEPHREWIEQQVRLRRNAQAIYQDLVDQFAFTASYESVKRFVRALRHIDPEQFDRLAFAPGEEAQVDYGEGALTRDPKTGRYRRPRLFVMTLRYSRRSFRRVVWKSSKQVWAQLHEEAFRYFGGAVSYVVLDNLREGVITPDLYEPEINRLYEAMLEHYGVVADPARVRKPGTGKSHVAKAVAYQAVLQGHKVQYLETDDFFNRYALSPTAQREARLRAILESDLLVLDDLFLSRTIPDAAGALLQTLIHQRYKLHRSVVVTSNRVVQDWGAYLGDNTMSTTILDRLMHHCHLLEFDGRSYRLKEAAETLARKSKTS